MAPDFGFKGFCDGSKELLDGTRFCRAELDTDVDLTAQPAERHELVPIHLETDLYEAREIIVKQGVDALFVRRPLAPLNFRTCGVVWREDLESAYEFRGVEEWSGSRFPQRSFSST